MVVRARGRWGWGGGEDAGYKTGANMDRVAEGHCEGEGAEGDVPSCAERKAEATSILQSEWEAKKRSINNLHL